MNRILIYCFTILIILACNGRHKNVHTKPVLLSIYNSNFPYSSYYVEFPNLKTFNIQASNFITGDSFYLLTIPEQNKLDSFLKNMTKSFKDESFIDGAAPEEMHIINFVINVRDGEKKINIAGHTAPPIYYSFADWVTELRTKLLKKYR